MQSKGQEHHHHFRPTAWPQLKPEASKCWYVVQCTQESAHDWRRSLSQHTSRPDTIRTLTSSRSPRSELKMLKSRHPAATYRFLTAAVRSFPERRFPDSSPKTIRPAMASSAEAAIPIPSLKTSLQPLTLSLEGLQLRQLQLWWPTWEERRSSKGEPSPPRLSQPYVSGLPGAPSRQTPKKPKPGSWELGVSGGLLGFIIRVL